MSPINFPRNQDHHVPQANGVAAETQHLLLVNRHVRQIIMTEGSCRCGENRKLSPRMC